MLALLGGNILAAAKWKNVRDLSGSVLSVHLLSVQLFLPAVLSASDVEDESLLCWQGDLDDGVEGDVALFDGGKVEGSAFGFKMDVLCGYAEGIDACFAVNYLRSYYQG